MSADTAGMGRPRVGVPDGIALGVTGAAWAATVLVVILDQVVPEPPTCSNHSFASSPAANTAIAILLIAMVGGWIVAVPATLVAFLAGRRRTDERLARIGRTTLIGALVLFPVAFYVLIATLFRGGICFAF